MAAGEKVISGSVSQILEMENIESNNQPKKSSFDSISDTDITKLLDDQKNQNTVKKLNYALIIMFVYLKWERLPPDFNYPCNNSLLHVQHTNL